MITYVQGGFFTSPASVLVNTVNTVGIMGKGIAKEFKAIYPEMFEIYRDACERGEFAIGSLLLYRSEHKSVLNFPTKRHWKAKSRLPDIEAGLKTFVEQYEQLGIGSIAFPQLGCGNGELDWENQVRPLMEKYLAALPIDIYIHIYDGSRDFIEHRDLDEMKRWLRNEPRALGFVEVWTGLTNLTGIDCRMSDWTITRENEETLSFRSSSEAIPFAREDALDLWQQLRSYGFLSIDDVPSVYAAIAEPLLSLFEQLPYIARSEVITFGKLRSVQSETVSEGLRHSSSRGVRLVTWANPAACSEQLALDGLMSVA